MKNEKVLINFKVPKVLKDRFDNVCQINGRSRTSVLLFLIDRYISSQAILLEQKENSLRNIDALFDGRKKVMGFKDFCRAQDELADENADFPLDFFRCAGPDDL